MQRWLTLLFVGVTSAIAAPAHAGEALAVERRAAAAANEASWSGAWLPTTQAARIGPYAVAAALLGGYDEGADGAGVLKAGVEGALFGRVALRVGVRYRSTDTEPAQLSVGLRVAALRQERHGVDLGVSAAWKMAGFTEEGGEVELAVAVGRAWGPIQVIGNVVYGQGVREVDERDVELRFAAMLRTRWVVLGLDSRGRINAGGGDEREAGHVLADLTAGPFAQVTLGPVALTLAPGVHARWVAEQRNLVGYTLLGGIAAAY